MSTQTENQSTPSYTSYTSLLRVSHIPIVECGISSLHSKLSTTPLLRTPYTLSLSVSSTLTPYLQSASSHFPFAPFLSYGDRAANKGLDIAQEKWPYPFESQPEQVWSDVRSVADSRVVKPAYGMAKSMDQSLTPLVDSFSFVVKKIDADADSKAKSDSTADADDEYQVQRAYALLRVLKDDIVSTPGDDQNALVKNIHATLTSFTQQSSALLAAVRSRSEGAASRVNVLAQAVLSELEKLAPLVSSVTSKTSCTLRDTTSNLRTILSSDDPLGQKIPKVGTAVQAGVKDVVEDIVEKVRAILEEIRHKSPPPAPSNNNINGVSKPSKRSSRPSKRAFSNENIQTAPTA
ncbi:hypothetical protein JB92DRAFT_3124838 [Gautieria morchelliformis]|nr:hypothetical protein JB92DRAFT_3124838 [Gautieria morchelliformis]